MMGRILSRGLLALGLALAMGSAAQARPDPARMNAGELAAFTLALPKGGELHNHISGAAFPEDLLAWAVADGLCVDIQALALTGPCQPSDTLKPAAKVLADDVLRSAFYDSMTTRHPGFRDRSGHDQFFSAFDRFGATRPERIADMMAGVLNGLARQNTFYLEAMVTPQGFATRARGSQAGWKGGDLKAQKAALEALGLDDLVKAAMAGTDTMEQRTRAILKCDTSTPEPGCAVTVRYLVQTIRVGPPEQTFAQIAMGVALVRKDPRWVGLQLVAPEDSPQALQYYDLHMAMFDLLTDHGRLAPVALHAGELTLKFATPEALSDHIAKAVRVAGAHRIGHGVDLPGEAGARALAAEMAAKGILVEVNLTSNAHILELGKETHPYGWFRQTGVPVSLSTDDAGILRTDLSHEYARAVDYGASYGDLVTSARNAIAFSFLAGEGLWRDPGAYRKPAGACAGQLGQANPRPGPCADLVGSSDKAREQWRYEHLLQTFEAQWG